MGYARLKPKHRTTCYAVEGIGGESYLSVNNPARDMSRNEVDHLYRELVEGVFYPVKSPRIIIDKLLVGYFFDEILDKEYKNVYDGENGFVLDTDMDWLPITQKILDSIKK